MARLGGPLKRANIFVFQLGYSNKLPWVLSPGLPDLPVLMRGPLLPVFLLKNHMQIRTHLMKYFSILYLYRHLLNILHLLIKFLLQRMNLIPLDILLPNIKHFQTVHPWIVKCTLDLVKNITSLIHLSASSFHTVFEDINHSCSFFSLFP